MTELIFAQIYNLRWLITIYIAFILLAIILSIILSRKFAWNGRNTSFYGFLYNLSDRCKVSYGISLTRMLFIIINAVFTDDMGFEALFIILVSTFFVAFFAKDYKILAGQLVTYAMLFGVLLLEGMFSGYYDDVESYWLIRLIAIFLGVFASLFAVYQQFIMHERLVVLSSQQGAVKIGALEFGITLLDVADAFGLRKVKKGESLVDVKDSSSDSTLFEKDINYFNGDTFKNVQKKA